MLPSMIYTGGGAGGVIMLTRTVRIQSLSIVYMGDSILSGLSRKNGCDYFWSNTVILNATGKTD